MRSIDWALSAAGQKEERRREPRCNNLPSQSFSNLKIDSFLEWYFFRGWRSLVNDNWSLALIELFSKSVALFYTEMISMEMFDKLLNSPVSPDIDLKVGCRSRSRRRSSPERGHNCISCTHWSPHCTTESCWVQWKSHAKGTQRWSINVWNYSL